VASLSIFQVQGCHSETEPQSKALNRVNDEIIHRISSTQTINDREIPSTATVTNQQLLHLFCKRSIKMLSLICQWSALLESSAQLLLFSLISRQLSQISLLFSLSLAAPDQSMIELLSAITLPSAVVLQQSSLISQLYALLLSIKEGSTLHVSALRDLSRLFQLESRKHVVNDRTE